MNFKAFPGTEITILKFHDIFLDYGNNMFLVFESAEIKCFLWFDANWQVDFSSMYLHDAKNTL